MKRYQMFIKFPDALAKHAQQDIAVEATSFPAAISRGLREVFKRPGIKGGRHRHLLISVTTICLSNPSDTEN